jgi:hypothetical protein
MTGKLKTFLRKCILSKLKLNLVLSSFPLLLFHTGDLHGLLLPYLYRKRPCSSFHWSLFVGSSLFSEPQLIIIHTCNHI